ncbi:MAG: thiamine diphosphokinase [Acholeplasmataceae bacterium]
MRAIVVTRPVPKDIRLFFEFKEDDYIIAVDQAVSSLYKQRVKIDLAVGDFDSLINKGMLTQLKTVKLNAEKDVTDTFQALIEAEKINPDAIYLIGGFGGQRIEHFIANLTLFDRFPKLVMMDDYTQIYLKDQGSYVIDFPEFVSFFGYPEAVITLDGFKYPLNNYKLTAFDPIGISNEVIDNAKLIVEKGRVIVVLSHKD